MTCQDKGGAISYNHIVEINNLGSVLDNGNTNF